MMCPCESQREKCELGVEGGGGKNHFVVLYIFYNGVLSDIVICQTAKCLY